jgi:hypothetical protein
MTGLGEKKCISQFGSSTLTSRMVAKVPSFEFFQNIFSYSDSTHLKTYPQKFSSKTCLDKKIFKRISAQYIRSLIIDVNCRQNYNKNFLTVVESINNLKTIQFV